MIILFQGLIDVFSIAFLNSHDMPQDDLQIGDKYVLHSAKQLT